jgi:hypothetical protein
MSEEGVERQLFSKKPRSSKKGAQKMNTIFSERSLPLVLSEDESEH